MLRQIPKRERKGVLHLIHSGGFYGAEAVVLNLCIGLKEAGYKAMIGCFCDSSDTAPEIGLRAEKKKIPVEYIYFGNKIDFKPIKEILRIVNGNNLALLHSHGYKPSVYCTIVKHLFNIPFVITCHLWTNETFRLRVYSLLERFSMCFASGVIGVSEPITKDICKWQCLEKKTLTIRNGIDIEKYASLSTSQSYDELKKVFGLRPDTRIVGAVGRLTAQKNHELFLEAASLVLKQMKKVEFLIMGEGSRMEFLKNCARHLGIEKSVHFLGYRQDVVQIMKLFDVFVLSSKDEGLPIVLLEAMSIGVPVVATRVGDVPSVIEDMKDGILVEKGDPASLATNIVRVLRDRNLAEALTKRAMLRVTKDYSMCTMAKKYLEIYERVTGYGERPYNFGNK